MSNRIGQQLGNYRLIRLLGSGGFAEVYLGEHIYLGTSAAIKVLYTQLTDDEMGKFRTEARIIARLNHPNIVRVLEFDVEDKTPFLVMDYAPNGTLRQHYPKGVVLQLPLIVAYVKQTADALQYAHDEKLIHRDIKPENMLLGRRNEILLSDFGIAVASQSERSFQHPQGQAGTPYYMAPEQIQGKPSRASDQYALGIVVYEWLSGERPFSGGLYELYGQHLHSPPPSLCDKVPTLSPVVEQVVLTALAKDPKERFSSVQSFATALKQACQTALSSPMALPFGVNPPGQPSLPTRTVVAVPPSQLTSHKNEMTPQLSTSLPKDVMTSPSEMSQLPDVIAPSLASSKSPPSAKASIASNMSQPFPRSISRRAVIVSLTGLAIAGGGLTWLTSSQKLFSLLSPHYTTPTTTHRPASTPIPIGTTLFIYRGHSHTDAGVVYATAWSPDGKRIASGSGDTTVQVWDALDGLHVLLYKGHSREVYTVAWSPDGKLIASGSGDATVQVWDATTGNSIYTYRGHTSRVNSVAWSPGGNRIASGSDDGTIQMWDVVTGSSVITYGDHSKKVGSVAWFSDGKNIVAGSEGAVQIWDTITGNSLFTYAGNSPVAWSPDGKYIVSGNSTGGLGVWDATERKSIYTYSDITSAQYGNVRAVAWSPDGKRIATAINSYDQSRNDVQVWDSVTGTTLFIFRDRGGAVNTVAWSSDGKRIASGGWGSNGQRNTVDVWQAV